MLRMKMKERIKQIHSDRAGAYQMVSPPQITEKSNKHPACIAKPRPMDNMIAGFGHSTATIKPTLRMLKPNKI